MPHHHQMQYCLIAWPIGKRNKETEDRHYLYLLIAKFEKYLEILCNTESLPKELTTIKLKRYMHTYYHGSTQYYIVMTQK